MKTKHIFLESPILQEVTVISESLAKIRYRAVLQKINEVGKNGVLYTSEIMSKGIKEIAPFIERGSLVSEMDHPITDNVARILNIFYKNVCQKILEVELNGNYIYGVCENTSNQRGQELYAFIKHDKIPVGFSLRAIGKTINRNGYKQVVDDIDIVTWDVVSKPSFFNCILQEVVDESVLNKVPLRESFSKLEETTSEILIESCSGSSCKIKKIDPSKPFVKTIHMIKNSYEVINPEIIPKFVYNKLYDRLRKIYF